MVHKLDFETKTKPRGKPFEKGHKIRKPQSSIMDSSRCQSGDEGGVVDLTSQSSIVEPADIPAKEQSDLIPLELIEAMDFMNGKNKLSIRLSKRNNRMFRIQIFLNEENEIRPVTYNGSSTAFSFWNLLKKSLIK